MRFLTSHGFFSSGSGVLAAVKKSFGLRAVLFALCLNGCGDVGWNDDPGTLAPSEADNAVFVNDGTGLVRAFAAQDVVPISDATAAAVASGESHNRRFSVSVGGTAVNSQYHAGTDELYMVTITGETLNPQWMIAVMAHASRRTGITSPQRTFALPAQERASRICLDAATDTLYVATVSEKLLVYVGVSQKSGQPVPDRTLSLSGVVQDMAYDAQRDRLYYSGYSSSSGVFLALLDRVTGYADPLPMVWPQKTVDPLYQSIEFVSLAVDAAQDRLYLLANAKKNPDVSSNVYQSLWVVEKASLGGVPAKVMDLGLFYKNGNAWGLSLDPDGGYVYVSSGDQNVYRLATAGMSGTAKPKLELVLKEKDARLTSVSFMPKTPVKLAPTSLQGAQVHAIQVVKSASAVSPQLFVVDKQSKNLAVLPSAVPDLSSATLSPQLLSLSSNYYGGELGYDAVRDILYIAGGKPGGTVGGFLTAVPGATHLVERSNDGLEGAVRTAYGPVSQNPLDLAVDAAHDVVYMAANFLTANTVYGASSPDYTGVLYKLNGASTVKSSSDALNVQSYPFADGLSVMAFDADRQKLYALNSHPWQARQLFMFDVATGVRTALEVPVGLAGDVLSLAVDPVHDRLYIGTAHSGIVAIDQVSTPQRQGRAKLIGFSGVNRLSMDTAHDRLFMGSGHLLGWFDKVSALTGAETDAAVLSLMYSPAVSFGNVVVKP